MKILFLSTSTGNGHNCCAKAMMKYLSEQGAECVLHDVYGQVHPVMVKLISDGYNISTSYIPSIYGSFYRKAEQRRTRFLQMVDRVNGLMMGRILRLIKKSGADAVVATHLFPAQILTHLRRRGDLGIPIIGVVTDYTIHPYWEYTEMDYYITANENLTNQAVKRGIPYDKIKPFGLPVDLKFSEQMSKSDARRCLGIEDKPTVLFIMGGAGYGGMVKRLKEMDKIEGDFQILAVFGKNDKAYAVAKQDKYRKSVYLYEYIDNIDMLMDSANCIVTKPGGITISESMAKGLPMVLINPIPGQEDRNVEYLVNNGVGLRVSDVFNLEDTLLHLFNDKNHLENMAQASKRAGRPYAVRVAGDFIMECIGECGCVQKKI